MSKSMEEGQEAFQDGYPGALQWGQQIKGLKSGTLVGHAPTCSCPAYLRSGINEADPVLVNGN